MKIDYKTADDLIKNITIQKDHECVLLYGEDSAAVNLKYKVIVDLFREKQYEIINILPESLRENESLLAQEFFAISMFSTNTLYILKLLEKENNFTKIVENLFEKNDVSGVNNFLIITANGLDTTSSLRKYAEKSKHIACIACYERDSRSTNLFISEKLKEYNFIFGHDIVEYLSNNIGSNTLFIENEIQKIYLYKGDDKKLTLDDVQKCVADVSNTDLNDFCNNFCSFNGDGTFRILNKIFREDVELVVIIRILIRYFLQLQKMRFLLDSGDTMENILKNGVFWKQQSHTRAHLQLWSLGNINSMLKRLMKLEKEVKFSENKNIEFENFVLRSLMVFRKK
ncbi:MAG: DNA polymerase III subunit delta [Rickettsiales bacterium]|jgi:DNA polymerase-3 subunit delta|nr:DNA polymerase III subunit delta [Rickettsiales bacterium]